MCVWDKNKKGKHSFSLKLKAELLVPSSTRQNRELKMDDTLYYILGGIITGGAVICFVFSYFQDHIENSDRKRRSLFSRINGERYVPDTKDLS